MKKVGFLLSVFVQLFYFGILQAQLADTVCVGEVKTYYISPSATPYSNPSGTFYGGVDTVFEWSLNDTYGTLNQAQLHDTNMTVTWGFTPGSTTLKLTETIRDTMGNLIGDTTDCTRENTLTIIIYDTLRSEYLTPISSVSGIWGDNFSFTTHLVSGLPPFFGAIKYQWQYSSTGVGNTWTDIPGAMASTYSIIGAQNQHAGFYRCRVSNRCNDVYTNVAELVLIGAPIVVQQPISDTVCEGSGTQFSMIVTSTETLNYQWQYSPTGVGNSWTNIPGATNETLTLPSAQLGNQGFYRCLIYTEMYPLPMLTSLSESCYLKVISGMNFYITTHQISCNGSANGEIIIDSIQNGYAPFSYLWSTGATTRNLNHLAPGLYTVTITESGAGCTITKSISIVEPDPLRFGNDSTLWMFDYRAFGEDNQIVEDVVFDKNNQFIYQVGTYETALALDNGSHTLSGGNKNMFVTKMTPDGNNVAWLYGSVGPNNTYGKGAGVDANGNIYVAGSFNISTHFGNQQIWSTGNSNYDGYIVKYNGNGNVQFAMNVGGLANDYINDIYVCADGDFHVTGSFEGSMTIQGQTVTSGEGSNIFVARFNSDGSLRWVRSIGNDQHEAGTSIVVDFAENTYVSGNYQGTLIFDGDVIADRAATNDIFIAQYDMNGNFRWARTISGQGRETDGGLDIDQSEFVIHTGTFENAAVVRTTFGTTLHTYTSAGGTDGFIQKFDRNGNLRWATTIGGTGNDTCSAIATDYFGNSYVAGTFRDSITFADITLYSTSPNNADAFIVKYSNTNTHHSYNEHIPVPIWAEKIGGAGMEFATSVAVDNSKHVFISGVFSDNIKFGNHILTASHKKDGFYAKLEEIFIEKEPYIHPANCASELDSTGYIQLSIAGGTPPYNFLWDNGYTEESIYNVPSDDYQLNVTDYNGCLFINTFLIDYIYNDPIIPQGISATPPIICEDYALNGGMLILKASAYSGNVTGDSLFWTERSCYSNTVYNQSVLIDDTMVLTIPAPTVTTTYYTYWKNICGRSECDSIVVEVIPSPIMPEVIIVDTNNYCAGTIDTLTLDVLGGEGEFLRWFKDSCNGEEIGQGGRPIKIPAPDVPTHIYARWEKDCAGAWAVSECQEIMINVNGAFHHNSYVVASDSFFCVNALSSVTLAVYHSENTVQWFSGSCGGTLIAEGDTMINILAPTQTTTYYASYTNRCNQVICDSVTINVYPIPTRPEHYQAIPQTTCVNSTDPITLIATGGTHSDDDVIRWYTHYCGNPNGYIGEGDTLIIAPPTETTSYFVRWETLGGCASHCDTITVPVYDSIALYIYNLEEFYCVNDAPIEIWGNLLGGEFSINAPSGIFNHTNTTAVDTATFTPAFAGAGNFTITYSYTTSESCQSVYRKNITIFELPVVDYEGLDQNYCGNAPLAPLVGIPAGGTFFMADGGPGITVIDGVSYFDAVAAGQGDHVVVYEYRDVINTGCLNRKEKNVHVYETVPLHFDPIPDTLCIRVGSDFNNPPYQLSGNNNPQAVFSGDGVTSYFDGTGVFSAYAAGPGWHTISLTYTQIILSDVCIYTVTQDVYVDTIPAAIFHNLQDAYCNNDDKDTLIGQLAGGIFAGVGIENIPSFDPGVSMALFDPSVVGEGTVEITYTVNSTTDGCDSVFKKSTLVRPAPIVTYSGLNPRYCHDAADVIIFGNHPAGVFTCDNEAAIVDLGQGKALFKPTAAGIGGPYTVTYTYYGQYCSESYSQEVWVVRPELTIIGLDEEYCSDQGVDTIYGLVDSSYFGGEFIGVGITMISDGIAQFDPDLPEGTYNITLNFTDSLGCWNTTHQSILIKHPPIMPDTAYVLDGNDAYCYGALNSITMVAEGGVGNVINWYANECGNPSDLIGVGPEITILAPTEDVIFYVSWENDCGLSNCFEVPVTVHPLPIMYINGDTMICERDTTTIYSAQQAGYSYIWKELESNKIVGRADTALLAPYDDMWYRQYAYTNFGCVDSLDFLVTVSYMPFLDLGEDLYLFTCDPVELNAGDGMGFDHYLWQDSLTTEPTFWVKHNGTYSVTVWNDGCTVTDSIYVQLCMEELFIPNAFTPNNNGLNDHFRPKLSDQTLQGQMYIYARTGSLVFQTESLIVGWDGRDMKGKECPNGTYSYIIKYQYPSGDGDGKMVNKTAAGAVILIR